MIGTSTVFVCVDGSQIHSSQHIALIMICLTRDSLGISLDRFALAPVPLLEWWLRQSGSPDVLSQRIDRLESAKECFRAACFEVDVLHVRQVFSILACALSSAVLPSDDASFGDLSLISPLLSCVLCSGNEGLR